MGLNCMSEPASGAHEVSAEARVCLDRLLASDIITRAPRVHSVLQFLVDALLIGRVDQLNEHNIGKAVFHRPDGYNPSEDNIVRVTISNARSRLEQYYREEGLQDTWILEIPRGRYVPALHKRESAPVHVPKIESSLVVPANLPASRVRRTKPWVIGAALFVAVSLGAWVFSSRSVGRSDVPESAGLLQDLFFRPNRRVALVVTDANMQAYRHIFQRTVPLEAYLAGDYDQGQADDSETVKRARHYSNLQDSTNVTSVVIAMGIQRAAYPIIVPVRHPREMSIRDMERDNAILLGGPWINPWCQLFEPRLNFRILPNLQDVSGSRIENVNPAPGEPKQFDPHAAGTFNVSYARIALVPNLSGSGKVLLLGANHFYSLEAAGDFVTTPGGRRQILQCLGVRRSAQLPNMFEIVLEVVGIRSTPESVRIVAHRPLSTK